MTGQKLNTSIHIQAANNGYIITTYEGLFASTTVNVFQTWVEAVAFMTRLAVGSMGQQEGIKAIEEALKP